MIRTRIAPSPTGYPHIGTIYQALFDYVYAKKNNGKFIIRIEDTDQQRLVLDAEKKIYETLDWFNLIEDESPRFDGPYKPYKQSLRRQIYKKYALDLINSGHAYVCDCSPDRLTKIREDLIKDKKIPMYDKHCRNLSLDQDIQRPYVIRLKVPENQKIKVKDEIRGEIEFHTSTIDDQVLIKSDGFPTYHLAVVVDDHLMEITHVVRGEEWITSFPKHWILYDFFEWTKPLFFHTPVLRNPDHSKLSKRHGHTNVEWYKTEGFLPEAILNFLALMGWSHPEEKEIFSMDEFIKLFDLKDLKPVAPIFDLKKLEWMNGMYIRELKVESLKLKVLKFDPSLKEMDDDTLDGFLEIAKSRIKNLKEFKIVIDPFLAKREINLSEEEKDMRKKLYDKLEKITDWNTTNIITELKEFAQVNNISFRQFYKILFGEKAGLPLADAFSVLGREKTLELIEI